MTPALSGTRADGVVLRIPKTEEVMPQFFVFMIIFGVLREVGRNRRPPDPPRAPHQPKSWFRIERAGLARFREWWANAKLPCDRWKVALAKWRDGK